jgi:hypothetical protein
MLCLVDVLCAVQAQYLLGLHVHFLVLICKEIVVILRKAELAHSVVHFSIFPTVVGEMVSFAEDVKSFAAKVLAVCTCFLGR